MRFCVLRFCAYVLLCVFSFFSKTGGGGREVVFRWLRKKKKKLGWSKNVVRYSLSKYGVLAAGRRAVAVVEIESKSKRNNSS